MPTTTGEVTQRLFNGMNPNQVFAQEAAGTGKTYWFQTDHEGTVTDMVTDTEGAHALDDDHIVFDAYGNVISHIFGDGEGPSPVEYASMRLDPTGLYYDGARYYDPVQGRFITQDPSGAAGSGTNLYAYTANNPVTRTDPTGLSFITGASAAVSGSFAFGPTMSFESSSTSSQFGGYSVNDLLNYQNSGPLNVSSGSYLTSSSTSSLTPKSTVNANSSSEINLYNAPSSSLATASSLGSQWEEGNAITQAAEFAVGLPPMAISDNSSLRIAPMGTMSVNQPQTGVNATSSNLNNQAMITASSGYINPLTASMEAKSNADAAAQWQLLGGSSPSPEIQSKIAFYEGNSQAANTVAAHVGMQIEMDTNAKAAMAAYAMAPTPAFTSWGAVAPSPTMVNVESIDPNIVGPSGAWTVQPTAQSIISSIAQQQANRGITALQEYMSPAQLNAYNMNPANGSRFLGMALHNATENELFNQYGPRFEYQTIGPDFIDRATGEMIELTTPGQVAAHLAKPGYNGVTVSTYTLPKAP